MTEKKTVPEQVQQLMSGVASHAGRHLLEISIDLHQTRTLLDGAIAKLTTSFSSLHAAVAEQQKIIAAVSQGAVLSQDELAQAMLRSEQISEHIGAAMVGLQFQDMTDQLLKRTSSRVAGTKEVFSALDEKSQLLMKRCGDAEAAGPALEQLGEQLRKQSDGLHDALWKSVSQQNMECGDIDLF